MRVRTTHHGFSLVEVVIGTAIFTLLAVSIYSLSTSLFKAIKYGRERVAVAALADHYEEVARNLPYSQIGTINGNPPGALPDEPNATSTKIGGTTYHVYYVVNYIDDPADGTIIAGTDPAPNDYKQIKLYVENMTTNVTTDFVTTIVPSSLESLSSGGALMIQVIDAVGQPVPNATIHIVNTALNPDIDLTRTSDANGNWIEVGLPTSANSYHITVTKSGYSSDQTYPISGGNPNPVKGDATILNGQVTQISFAIDAVSNLTFYTLDQFCQPIQSVGLEVRGSKLIGTPAVYKFDSVFNSNAVGVIPMNSIEWDDYTPALTDLTYMVYGSSPIQEVSILPGTSQSFTLILGAHTNNSLLVIVKDSTTGNPIEGATVTLNTISPPDSSSKITGGSIWSQRDWSGGAGQVVYSNMTKYFSDDGNVDAGGIPAGLRLRKVGSSYLLSGSLESSTFDTGTASTTYTTITWQPTSQDVAATLKFQIASNNDGTTWNYTGPDGTASTYYTVSGSTLNAIHALHRYIRYKAFLSTTDTTKTPVLTSVNINYVPGCFTPGQVLFSGLAGGNNYSVTVNMTGFQQQTLSGLDISGYYVLPVSLAP